MLEVRLFGDARLTFDGRPWIFAAPPRTLPLLAYLLMHRRDTVTRARLAVLLWPDVPEEEGRANLRRHLHHLGKALPTPPGDIPWLLTTKATVQWNPHAETWIDVEAFEQGATDLYTGDVLPDCYDDWIVVERERLRSRALDDMYSRAVAARTRRAYSEAASHLERILAIDEWREDALRLYMASKHESGDRSGALALYERFAHRLQTEMHIAPMPETTTLRDAIVADRGSELPRPPAPTAGSKGTRHGFHVPFVGRHDALEKLTGKWTRAAHGSGSTTFLVGEPGIGKSRLSSVLATLVEAEGGRVLIGQTSAPESMPYQPLIDALRHAITYLRASNIDSLWINVLGTVIPEVLSLKPDLAPAEPIDEARARSRLHEAFIRAFTAIAHARPLLLVFEDLHWAGTETVDALAALTRRAGGLPIAIVATLRGEHTQPALREIRRTLQREGRAGSITLSRLSHDEIAHLVRDTPDLADAPHALAEAVFRSSEGNPLFAVQLISSYLETKQLPAHTIGSNAVTDAIAERVGRLPDDVRAIAEVCASVGREFTLDVVCHAGGWSEDAALTAIGILMDRQLVRETGSPDFEYGFTHALIAQTIYALSRNDVRAGRHRRIAERLEQSLDAEEIAATIARHWRDAGDAVRASRQYLRAAERALDIYARNDAIEYAREGLGLATDTRLRYELLHVLAQAEHNFGDVNVWDQDLAALESAAGELGSKERFIALSLRERFYAQVGDRVAQDTLLSELQRIAEQLDSSEHKARALDAVGTYNTATGNFSDAVVAFRAALAAAPLEPLHLRSRISQHLINALSRAGDTAGARAELARLPKSENPTTLEQLDMLWAEGSFSLTIEDCEWTRRVGQQIVTLSARVGDQELEGKAHWMVATAWQRVGKFEEAKRELEIAAELFERLRQPHLLSTVYVNIAFMCLERGLLDETIVYCDRAVILGRETGANNLVAYALCNRVDAERLAGRADVAVALGEEALALARPSGEAHLIAACLESLGISQCKNDDAATGISLLQEALTIRRESHMPLSMAITLSCLIEALFDERRFDEIAEYANALKQLLEGESSERHVARMSWVLSLAALARSDRTEAELLLAQARGELAALLATFSSDEERAAYCALPFSQRILAPLPLLYDPIT